MPQKPEQRAELLPANALDGKRLGLSLSDSPDLERLGLLDTHFRMTLGEVARVVITAGGSLYYGGHLKPEGITTFLIEELHRYARRNKPLKVCLAWTVHRAMTEEELNKQKEILELSGEIILLCPKGRKLTDPVNEPTQKDFSPENKSASLFSLRTFMSNNTDARVVIGGKRHGFEGDMPGIVEEILFALEKKQPLYLAGGFGGATLDVINVLHPNNAEWFPRATDDLAPDERMLRGLERVRAIVTDSGWDGQKNGLTVKENKLLAASYRSSEVAALVGLGMGRLLIDN
ncbi:MAG: hypothetical protein HRT36_07155 [Alphaproteobacteria bacterium]|nr:hypothetical protein [Alphaproteobacteria bacterium]